MLLATVGFSLLLVVGAAHSDASPDLMAYQFDDSLLMGSPMGKGQLSRFNRPDQIDAGTYSVDLFVNGAFISRQSVEFRAEGEGEHAKAVPCLSDRFLVDSVHVLASKLLSSSVQHNGQRDSDPLSDQPVCLALDQRVPGGLYKLDVALLRLDLSIPQAVMDNKPRGYVSASEWDAGDTMAFVNYDGSYYHSKYDSSGSATSDYGYLGLNSGINLGLWRLRQQSSYRYSDYAGRSSRDFNAIRTYAQRALPELRSEMTVGDSFTPGGLFSSMGYRGVQLASDDRMLPDSQRGYAPQIHGVAATNARVVVSQNGHDIYETTVAPGPFVINDLGGTSYQGDLNVRVIEADGQVSSFTVPFAAVSDSMRPGQSRYSVSLGQARYYGDGEDLFGDFTYQRGITNSVTLNSGARVANDYLALLGGGVLASDLGAFGLNTTFSSAKVEDDARKQGWRMEASYSRTFQPTATTLTLAGYRYSTDGFRDLSDVLGVRAAEKDGATWSSTTYQQRNQFVTTISQSLGGYGNLYLSGSTADYYDGSSRDTQVQTGYSSSWRDVSYNLSYTRQKSVHYDPTLYDDQPLPDYVTRKDTTNNFDDSVFMLSVSLPLGSSSKAPNLTTSVTRRSGDSHDTSYQTGLSGTAGESRTLGYSINANRDSDSRTTDWGGTLQKQLPSLALGTSYSQGEGYKQVSGSARGAAVLHSGGLTFGPYLGDTFALVEAKGAEGATVRGGQGARINSSGYAVVPALSPYHYNPVSIDPAGINQDAELVETDRQVAPYAGAMVKLTFKTLAGHALLIKATRPDGSVLPLGADVLDEQGATIGMVGQGGQLYARAEGEQGHLKVRWGEASDESCQIPYDLKGQDDSQALIHLDAHCVSVTK
ncbi:fimbria/pilus outer membrane usher protein [Pseudomonas nitroreducens]|uniref:fimbria/pilus outer membrane usher protein n=1 Tax=Pseudomonas nitroreducens TaxID=46680 RepID=UPI003FA767E0